MDLVDFLSLLQSIAKNEPQIAKKMLFERCKTDLELFSRAYFSHYCRYNFNEFHHSVFENENSFDRQARRIYIAPRGSAKSTLVSLITPIRDLVFGLEKFILLISHTEDQAVQKLKDIRSELLENAALQKDFGPFFNSRNVGATEFVAHSKHFACKFKAVGSGTEIRGIRHKENRPTKIIFDDIEHSERVENELLRKKDADYFFEVVSKVGSETTNITGVGTILHEDSLLQKLKNNPVYETKSFKSVKQWSTNEALWQQWKKIFTDLDNPARKDDADRFYQENQTLMLEGTEVLWPEKEDYYYLMKEMIEIGTPAFLQEKQNEPVNPETRIFNHVTYYDVLESGVKVENSDRIIPWAELKNHCFGVLDPATGQTKPKIGLGSDYSCLVAGYLHPTTGRIFVHYEFTKVVPPSVFIDQIFNTHETFEFQKFGVEINLYRNLLMQDIIKERKERERKNSSKLTKLAFYEIENTAPKRQRIFALEPKVSHGWIVFNRNLSKEFMNQILQFPNAAHDDAPDALEMLYNLCLNKYPASPLSVKPFAK